MILETKKLFFKKLNIVLEDVYFDQIIREKEYKKYGSVVAVTYRFLSLPEFSCVEKFTAIIDLTQSEEGIFRGMSSSTRNEIHRTEKDSDFVFKYSNSPTKDSYELYSSFEYTQGRIPRPILELKQSHFFGMWYQGVFISGMYVMVSFEYMRSRSIFSKRLSLESKDMRRRASNASRRLMWEMCIWGKKNGYKGLDLGSVNKNNPKTRSIADFKLSFGGNLVKEYAYIYKSKSFQFFERFVHLKHFFVRLLRRGF